VETGEQLEGPALAALKDAEWASDTTLYTYATQVMEHPKRCHAGSQSHRRPCSQLFHFR
jgi:hypothetical protein